MKKAMEFSFETEEKGVVYIRVPILEENGFNPIYVNLNRTPFFLGPCGKVYGILGVKIINDEERETRTIQQKLTCIGELEEVYYLLL